MDRSGCYSIEKNVDEANQYRVVSPDTGEVWLFSVLDRPAPTATGFDSVGVELGDIGFDLAYGKTFESGLIALGGVVRTIPTATDKRAGGDQWLLGPEAVLGVAKKWGVLGALASHSVDVGGSNKADTKITGGSYFYAFNLGGGPQWG
jgi:hypothetical protein